MAGSAGAAGSTGPVDVGLSCYNTVLVWVYTKRKENLLADLVEVGEELPEELAGGRADGRGDGGASLLRGACANQTMGEPKCTCLCS